LSTYRSGLFQISNHHRFIFLVYFCCALCISKASSPVLIYKAYREKAKPDDTAIILLFLLFAIVILLTCLEIYKGLSLKWLDVTLFGLTGLLGILIAFIWLRSRYTELRDNLNILWANPLNIISAILLMKRFGIKGILYINILIVIFLNLCFLAGMLFDYQHIILLIIPGTGIIFIRQLAILKQLKSCIFIQKTDFESWKSRVNRRK
jgi:hypothetical protein